MRASISTNSKMLELHCCCTSGKKGVAFCHPIVRMSRKKSSEKEWKNLHQRTGKNGGEKKPRNQIMLFRSCSVHPSPTFAQAPFFPGLYNKYARSLAKTSS